MSLRDKLKTLEELQAVDVEMHELSLKREELPARRRVVEAALMALRQAVEGDKIKLADSERERRQSESLIASEKDKVKKWESRLAEIKTPREYAALSREIEIGKKTNDTQAEHVIELTALAETQRTALSTRETTLATEQASADSKLKAIVKEDNDIASRMASLETERRGKVSQVDPGLLSKYENIRKRRAGLAVVAVVGNTCRGCNMNIPPQLANTLRRADSIEICPVCNRIIYNVDALNPSVSPA